MPLSQQSLLAAQACGGRADLRAFAPAQKLKLTVELSARWHAGKLDAARFSVSGSVRGTADPSFGGRPACAFDTAVVPRVSLPPTTVWVGRVPIVITPRVTFGLHGDGGTSGPAGYHAAHDVTTTAGVTYAKGRFRPLARTTARLEAQPAFAAAKADLDATLRTRLALLIDGVPGAEMTYAAGTQLRADPAIEAPAPWRTLRGTFAAGGSLALDRWLLPLSLVGRDPGAHCEAARLRDPGPTCRSTPHCRASPTCRGATRPPRATRSSPTRDRGRARLRR